MVLSRNGECVPVWYITRSKVRRQCYSILKVLTVAETKFKASGVYNSMKRGGHVHAADLIVKALLGRKKILIPKDTPVLNPAFFIICVMDIP